MRWCALMLLAACAGKDAAVDDTTAPDDTAATFPDLTEGLEPDPVCEDFQGSPIPGATGWFIGDFTLDGGVVTGTEVWLLLANTTLDARGGSDCRVTWEVVGEVIEAGAQCPLCTYGLRIAAQLDPARTDCPEDLYEGEEVYSVGYDVRVEGDAAAVRFAASGEPLGEGVVGEQRLVYRSEADCFWF